MELQHHGVKGQKWGVRRYQNKDGTLTRAGKRRQKIIDKEMSFYEGQIRGRQNDANTYRDRAETFKKLGNEKEYKYWETEARWAEHEIKHFKDYNKKLSEIDVSEMKNTFEVWGRITALGNMKLNDINNTWKEPVYDEKTMAAIRKNKTKEPTKDMISKYLREQFGNDMATPEGRKAVQSTFEIDDLEKWASNELKAMRNRNWPD